MCGRVLASTGLAALNAHTKTRSDQVVPVYVWFRLNCPKPPRFKLHKTTINRHQNHVSR